MSVKAVLLPLAGSHETSVPKVGVNPLVSLVCILKISSKFINCQNILMFLSGSELTQNHFSTGM